MKENSLKEQNNLMEKIVSLCKRRGFIFQSSEIYGGLEALWDYGPLGSLMKNNIKEQWLKRFLRERDDMVLIDGAVLMHPKVWEASGHTESFSDPLVECKSCHKRFRLDEISNPKSPPDFACERTRWRAGEIRNPKPSSDPRTGLGQTSNSKSKIQTLECPECGGELTKPRQFNLMFKTFLGPVEDQAHQTYLRPETAQSMFVNFKNIVDTSRKKIPFGIAQIGKSFRNEITTGNFIFRSKEFEIAEIEYFVEPGSDDKHFEIWLKEWHKFFLDLGLRRENLRLYEHPKKSLAHYSKRTVDIEYKFPFGWSELAGVANRTDFDLKRHAQFSGKDLNYFNEEAGKTYIPYVIEPTLGIERLLLALLVEAYQEIKGGRTETTESSKEIETVLRLNKNLAPIKIAVLPLVKNKTEVVKKAKEVYQMLKPHFMCQYDEAGSVGRRYRRQDEIGTPLCLTIDFDSFKKEDVTVRSRDTMKQERVKIKNLIEFLKDKLEK